MSDYLWDGQPRQYCRELPALPDPHATGVWIRPANWPPPPPPRRPAAVRALILLATVVAGAVGAVVGVLLLWLAAIFAFSL